MINFVVCNLEDVLLTENRQISEEVLELIGELKKKDIMFCVASGMNYDAVYPLFDKMAKDIVFICNDGGVVIYQDKVISKTPIDRLLCFDVSSEFEKDPKYQLVFATERNAMVETHNIDFINHLKEKGIEVEKVKDIKSMHEDITKITIYARDGLDEQSYAHFFEKWSKKANVAVSNLEQAYITAEYVTKGTALALVQHVFNISPEDTVVFGGGYSDIDMFKYSYFSYAMQYADAQVKRNAQHIAENVNTILEDILRMR